MRKIVILSTLMLAAACTSADKKFESACLGMAKMSGDVSKQEGREFCSCFADSTSDMDKKGRKEFIKMMKKFKKDSQFDEELQEAIDKGRLSESDGRFIFSAIKGCALNSAM
ncbi:MAG: hypothetical protein ACWA5T_02205 [Parvularcula sp.]